MTTKYLDSTGLSYFWSKVKARDDADRGTIFFGEVDDTSTSTVFTATIDGITEYHDGLAILLKNGVVTSAAGFTININGLGAKPSYNNMAAATADTTIFNVNYTMLFVYDSTRIEGGAWICYRGYNSNDNTIGYQIRTNVSSLPMKSVTYRYRLLFTSADGKGFVPATNSTSTNATASRTVCQDPIDPFGRIVYYSTTTSVAAGSRPSVTTLWDRYNITLGYSFNRTGAALTLTSWKPVYIKCAPQNDGSAIIDSTTPYVQDLPTTADGKIYIALGIAYSATQVELFLEHPVYHFSQGSIRKWSNEKWTINEREATNNNFTITGASIPYNANTSLNDKIDAIVSTGGEPNVIESVSFNGVNQLIIQKNVDIESHFARTTVEANPSMVLSALQEGKTVEITYTHPTYGNIVAHSFNYSAGIGMLAANVIADYFGTEMCFELLGDTSNNAWTCNVTQLAKLSNIPTNVSALTNDAGYLTTETDPTVPSWAKASTKPSYTASEVGALDNTGGQVTGNITLYAASGNSPSIIFQRGTLTDNYNDWQIYDKSGFLYFAQRGQNSSAFADQVYFNTTGGVYATTYNGSGANLTGVLKPGDITSSITSSSTNSEAAGAKAVYDMVGNIESLLSNI